MKKFILIGIALITMFATQVRATCYQPTDQLQTHLIVQQSAPVLFASFDLPVQPVYMFATTANKFITVLQLPGITRATNTFAVIDPGRIRNKIASVSDYCKPLSLMYSYKSPVDTHNCITNNYNTLNYSYGLRY